MDEKRCCCFSLTTGTGIVLILSGVEAVFGLFFNIELLLLLMDSGNFNPLSVVINKATIEDFDGLYGIVLAAIGLYAFWVIFSVFAARGNIAMSHGHLTPWVLTTYLIILFSIGISIYFAVKFQGSMQDSQEFFINSKPTKATTYLTLLVSSSGSGIVLFLNVYFAHVVQMRGKEMDHDFSMLALYIMSHVNQCPHANQERLYNRFSSAPPSYPINTPPYLPPAIMERANSSSGSTWSLSCEGIRSMSNDQTNLMSQTSNEKKKTFSSIIDLTSAFKRDSLPSYQPLNVKTNQSGVFP